MHGKIRLVAKDAIFPHRQWGGKRPGAGRKPWKNVEANP